MDATTLKLIHILSAILLFGTGLGTAFHGMASNLSKDVRAIAVANRNVVLADWLFTTPTVVIQPVSGLWLALEQGWPLSSGWIVLTLVLYAIAGACWLPVVWLQIRMRRMAEDAVAAGTPLPPLYRRYFRIWFALGWPAFTAMVALVGLMVFKPEF
ncbi:hypothetical protein TSH58p_23130 (plasmid) [Azospirillum sp. TSH58]|uniref:DUF2269 family protein n=1 Tax=Azospirillum sp. TSH58 TaxID=664962 RepID=UPI000D5FE374|nr:DUF2269 domain-containing protein [Azospirillum sp. TSH58]AWJ86402.1 hypothetical protein TSH58p_23130 [Azospirillum sp. TSH58]PWC70023.1 hypothetical protein TSH58_13930 [Azospirillum sp. TSH58]